MFTSLISMVNWAKIWQFMPGENVSNLHVFQMILKTGRWEKKGWLKDEHQLSQISKKISRKQIHLLLIRYMDEWQNVPTLHIVIYFAGTAVFMSFNINQQKHNTYYELSNIIHAKLKPISSKCCLGQTNSHQQAAQLTKMALSFILLGSSRFGIRDIY